MAWKSGQGTLRGLYMERFRERLSRTQLLKHKLSIEVSITLPNWVVDLCIELAKGSVSTDAR
jgi:hypothetical protein